MVDLNWFPIGKRRATSTSKRRKRIATSQNFGQKGTTLGPAGSNPHSKGAAALPGRLEKSIPLTGSAAHKIDPRKSIVNRRTRILAI